MNARYELVTLKNGARSVRSLGDGETFHPVAGPVAEAEALYVRQLRLCERVAWHRRLTGVLPLHSQDSAPPASGDFVIWDVGLGAGGNVLAALQQLAGAQGAVEIVSFDRTLEPLRFALQHADELKFPLGFETLIGRLLSEGSAAFEHGALRVQWTTRLGDIPSLLASGQALSAPHAILFDAFSPARNSEMWTQPLFENLFRRLDPRQPCSLATFSRSTVARVAMLLAGFFVGAGVSVAGKEETTIAANTLELIDQPLGRRWLERARVSQNAEPWRDNQYHRGPLAPETWERLRQHPQFAT